MELQQRYAQVYPSAAVLPGEVYLSPGFDEGRNVLCAVDEQGRLAAYAPVLLRLVPAGVPAPHTIWAEVKVDPGLSDPTPLKNRLFDEAVRRAREIGVQAPGHEIDLTFQYYPFEVDSISFVQNKGCVHSANIYQMARDLGVEIPRVPAPLGVTVRHWRMETQAEQEAFIEAHNEVFADAPMTLGDWQ